MIFPLSLWGERAGVAEGSVLAMTQKLRCVACGSFFLLGGLSPNAFCEEIQVRNAPFLLAGEIELAPQSAPQRSGGPTARNQKERASAYQSKSAGVVDVLETEDEGVMSPRGGVPVENRAYENKLRARTYQQGKSSSQELGLEKATEGLLGESPLSTQDRARDSRLKARSYVNTSKEVDLSNVGRDGIPVIPCDKDVSNESGRIGGDENISGTLFQIYRNGKPVKVRCR